MGNKIIRLKEIREQKSVSRKELAELTGLTETYICELEIGRKLNPSREAMGKIANALGETVDNIFY